MKTRNNFFSTALQNLNFPTGFLHTNNGVTDVSESSLFQRIKNRLINALVQDIPEEMLVCEKCRELECSQARWETCPNRLNSIQGISRN